MAKAGGGDKHAQASVAGMVLIRLFIAAFFLYSGISDLLNSNAFLHTLKQASSSTGSYVVGNFLPGFAEFLQHTVSLHADAIGWGLMLAQIVVGALLLIGLLTRLAALLALAMNTFWLLATLHTAEPSMGVNAAFLAMELAIIIAAAGRTWGVDRILARRSRVKILW